MALTVGIGAMLLALATIQTARAQITITNTGTGPNPNVESTNGTNAAVSITTGTNNTAYGLDALRLNTTGTRNTAVGALSLRANVAGHYNTALGYGALNANTASNNTALGYLSLFVNTSGTNNVAAGFSALGANTTGRLNTALGVQALRLNVNGASNVALGYQALFQNVSGGFNVAVGDGALYNATGSGNIGIGEDGGVNLTTGSNNIYIGNPGGVAGGGTMTESGIIRIGYTKDGAVGFHTDTYLAGVIHGNGGGLSNVPAEALSGTISGAQIADGAVSSSKLAAGAVQAANVSAGAIGSTQLAADSVTNIHLATGIDASKITTGTFPAISGANLTNLNGANLAGLSVPLGALAANSVDSSKIVNGSIVNSDIAASAAIADTKLAAISTAGKVANSATTATSVNTANTIVLRDASGNFTAGTVTGIFNGNGANLTSLNGANLNAGTVASGALATGAIDSSKIADGSIVNSDIAASAAIADTKLAEISSAGKVANSATTATSVDTPSTIVLRDASGNFTAGTVTGSFNGNGANLTNLNGANLNAGTVASGALATGAIDSSKIADGSIGNADIAEGAAIATSKIAGLGPLATVSPAGTPGAGTFLRGDNTWAALPQSSVYDGGGNLLSAVTATSDNTPSTIVFRDANGSFTAGAVTGSFNGDGANLTNLNGANLNAGTVASGALATGAVDSLKIADGSIVNADIAASAAIADTKLATISAAGKVANSATTATDSNTPSTIVLRDASGNFTAGTVTGSFNGNGANLTNLNGASLNAGTVDSSKIADGSIGNADIAEGAAIATSKIAGLGPLATISPAGTPGAGTFLRGDNTWAAIPQSLVYDGAGNPLSAVTATSANTPSTIVFRDASGNFTAGMVTGIFNGDGANLTSLNGANLNAGTVASGALATGAVDSSKIADGSIGNTDIAAGAAIATSKIAGLGPLATVSPAGTPGSETFLRGDNTWATLPQALVYDGAGNLLGSIVRWESDNEFYIANKNGYMFRLNTNGNLMADTTVYWSGLNATGTPYIEDTDSGVSERRYAKAVIVSPVGDKFYVSTNIQATGESASVLSVLTRSRESVSLGTIVNSNITLSVFPMAEVVGGAATVGLVITGSPPKVATPITIR